MTVFLTHVLEYPEIHSKYKVQHAKERSHGHSSLLREKGHTNRNACKHMPIYGMIGASNAQYCLGSSRETDFAGRVKIVKNHGWFTFTSSLRKMYSLKYRALILPCIIILIKRLIDAQIRTPALPTPTKFPASRPAHLQYHQ